MSIASNDMFRDNLICFPFMRDKAHQLALGDPQRAICRHGATFSAC